MKTLEQFAREPTTLPMTTAWYLTDLAEAKGRQALFIRQTPNAGLALVYWRIGMRWSEGFAP